MFDYATIKAYCIDQQSMDPHIDDTCKSLFGKAKEIDEYLTALNNDEVA